MPRANKIQFRTGTTTPAANDFVVAEPAWDSSAGKLWVKNAAGSMVEIGGASSPLAVYASASSFPATGSATTLYLDSGRSRLYRWVAADSVYAEVGTVGVFDSVDGGVYGS